MAIGFVGKGLGMMAAVVPLGVVTPAAMLGVAATPPAPPAETFRLKAENNDNLTTETGNYLTRDQGA